MYGKHYVRKKFIKMFEKRCTKNLWSKKVMTENTKRGFPPLCLGTNRYYLSLAFWSEIVSFGHPEIQIPSTCSSRDDVIDFM